MRGARCILLSLSVPVTVVGCAGFGGAPGAWLREAGQMRATSIAPTPTHVVAMDSARDSLACASGAAASDSSGARQPALARRDSFEPRWRQWAQRVVTVRIEDAPRPGNGNANLRGEVVHAIDAWQIAGAPLTFVVVEGDAPADVVVHWIDKFDSRYEGWTTVSWNHEGWLVSGDVQLALRSPAGQLLTSGERERVAMHEFGHVLGLTHTDDTSSIMSPVVRVSAIAPADVATLRALYSAPNGAAADQTVGANGSTAGGRCAVRNRSSAPGA